jgi:hypothetical protein
MGLRLPRHEFRDRLASIGKATNDSLRSSAGTNPAIARLPYRSQAQMVFLRNNVRSESILLKKSRIARLRKSREGQLRLRRNRCHSNLPADVHCRFAPVAPDVFQAWSARKDYD